MPLLPFKLFKAETRLIIHKKCLYKLKLTYKPDISSSSSKTLLNEKDEINAELTQVIQAVLFLVNAKKNIPQKIITQFFTVSVTVKFWKISQKLRFSKNGSRLKCGHLIELALDRNESRIQKTNMAPTLVDNDFKNEDLENVGHLGLRQFVIDSDESDSQSYSSSDEVTMDNSLKHSKSAANVDSGGFSSNRHVQEVHLDKDIRHQNYLDNQVNQTPLTSDISFQTPWTSDPTVKIPLTSDPTAQTFLTSDPTAQTPLTSDISVQTPWTSDPTVKIPLTSDPTVQIPLTSDPTVQTFLTSDPTAQTPLTSDISVQTPWPSDPAVQIPLNSDSTVQTPLTSDPTVQTPLNSEPIVQTVSLSAQALNERQHLSASLNETPSSPQALPTFISSCTQTNFEELDATADIPELNSRDEAISHVLSDHAYPKSLPPSPIEAKNSVSKLEVSNSNKNSAEFRKVQISGKRLSVAGMKSSNFENQDNKDDDISVDDDDDGYSVKGDGDADCSIFKGSGLKEINNSIEPTKGAHTIDILGNEPENNIRSRHNSGSNASNDVWGIGSETLDVGFKLKTAVQSQSNNNQEMRFSPQTEKPSTAHQSSQLVIPDGISLNSEKSKTSPEKSQSISFKKRSKSKDKNPDSYSLNVPRLKSLRSYKKVESVLDQNPRSVKKTRHSFRQTSVPREKKTPSNHNTRKQRQKQEIEMQQEVPTDVSFGLHDRYQVQTQELQEDLKLQDLAHPSSSDTKRKRRSFFDYINFTYFLQRAKKTK